MANTENIEAKLAAYVDGELDAAGRAEIEQYLTTNPQHRLLIDELRQAKNYLQELPRATAPVEVAEMISQQLERAALLGDVEIGAGSGSTNFSRWPQLRAIAAILLLTVGLAGVLYYVLPSPKPMSPQSAIVTPDLPPDELKVADARVHDEPTGAVAIRGGAAGDRDNILGAAGSRGSDRTEVSNAGRTLGVGGGGGSVAASSGALYLMVNTPDPASANTQVVNYFASNQIDYEQVAANDMIGEKKEADRLLPTENRAPAAATLPEFNNVAPGAVNPPALEALKDSATPTTNSVDKLALAKNLPADASIKQQSSFACYKAKMTREEAATMSETLSQPKLRQVAQIVSPDFHQQQQSKDDEASKREQAQQPEQMQATGQVSGPTTNESSPTSDQVLQSASAPAYADRSAPRRDVLAAGDNVRIRMSDPLRAGSLPSDETRVIDEEGYVELPHIGRVKAAGLTPYQLSSSIIPQTQERNRDSQSPNIRLTYSIEKIAPDTAAMDQKFPATQDAGAIVTGALPAAKPEPATGPTTRPTTNATELASALNPQPSAEKEKIDVVVIVQNAEGPTTAPAPDMSMERHTTASTSPATQSAIPSPTTAPTTAPAR